MNEMNEENKPKIIEQAPQYSIYSTITCHQCKGTGKDSKDEKSARCCSCYGLGKIFLKPNGGEAVDYITQREIVQSKNYRGSNRYPIKK